MLQLDKASTVAGIAKMLEEKGNKHTIIVAANASDPADASLCSFRRCSNWRIF
jgi:F0F1-type ATP synthase alpha subunit